MNTGFGNNSAQGEEGQIIKARICWVVFPSTKIWSIRSPLDKAAKMIHDQT